ncbi:MAG: sigma-70 family RNA polymerase sigma factor [Chloroflexota bacterium]|nr:sigma-70 family RNA polymerase sigma factor [Chloroflexota bacterium]
MDPGETIANDNELERRAASGEREAFAALYERYARRIYDFLLRMVRDDDEAADLMQETFVRAMKALSPERAGGAQFSTWIFTIARNLALTRLERRKRTVPLGEEGEEDGTPAYQAVDQTRLANPGEAVEAEELASLVWQAAQGLEEKQYSLLDLHVRQGLDSAEIAQVLGVSKGNAYTMLSRLRDAFEGAVGALVMLQRGRRRCVDLDRLLRERGVTAFSPVARKLIERHAVGCFTCTDQRRQLVSATAILRALALLPLPFVLKRRVAEAAWQSWRTQQVEQASLQGSAGTGPGVLPAGRWLGRPLGFVRQLAVGANPWMTAAVGGVIATVLITGGTCMLLPAVSGQGGGPAPSGNARVNQVAGEVHAPVTATAAAPTVQPSPASTATAPAPTVAATAVPTEPPAVAPSPTRAVAPTAPQPRPTLPPPPVCGASPAPVLGPASEDPAYAATLRGLSNQYRAGRGRPAFVVDARLTTAAFQYARFVVETEWWLHHPPGMTFDGTFVPGIHIDAACHDMYDRAVADGYPPAVIGENVMWGTADLPASSMFSIAMTSADHEDPADARFAASGLSCFRRLSPSPAEIACVQVFGGVP